jgi:hypothetical protein
MPSSIVKIQRSTKFNRIPNATKWAKWTYQHLENAMDVVERKHIFLRKETKYWNIPLTSLSNHLNGRTRRRKMGPQSVLIEHEDATIVTWVLNVQTAGLFITLQQLKLKVAKVTQIKPTPFQNGAPRPN